eukprot:m.75752 g.75752  ORF g.75752 m.75752 type:complete len:248 (-) comp12459_c2_seq2:593-1336(-)
MELPSIGQNCAAKQCNRLDFLPVECKHCHRIFCDDHWQQSNHGCSVEVFDDRRVHACPLCDEVVLPKAGENPNVAMEAHIASGCQKRTSKAKLKKNVCSQPKCKRKEVVPFNCPRCRKQLCLAHRNEMDHDCRPVQKAPATRASKAAPKAVPSSKPKSSTSRKPLPKVDYAELDRQRRERAAQQMQAGMSEDEALRQAMAASMQQPQQQSAAAQALSEEEQLARAIQASLNEQQGPKSSGDGSCTIS